MELRCDPGSSEVEWDLVSTSSQSEHKNPKAEASDGFRSPRDEADLENARSSNLPKALTLPISRARTETRAPRKRSRDSASDSDDTITCDVKLQPPEDLDHVSIGNINITPLAEDSWEVSKNYNVEQNYPKIKRKKSNGPEIATFEVIADGMPPAEGYEVPSLGGKRRKRAKKVTNKKGEKNTKKPHERKKRGKGSSKQQSGKTALGKNDLTKCSICEREFSCISRLKVHMRIHNTVPIHRCDECKKCFDSAKKLNTHSCDFNKSCLWCDKVFTTAAGWKQHEQTHAEKKNYECKTCGKLFHVPSSLSAHMSTHVEVKPFKCVVCGKSFAKRRNLRIHLRIHTKEKPFECEICKKRFTQRSNLTAHKRIHNNEHPHICQFCGRSFAHQSTLASHTRSHTKEMPYQCTVCLKKFAHRGSLSNHQLVHTKEKKFSCSYCNVKFAHRQSWKYHENLHVKYGDTEEY